MDIEMNSENQKDLLGKELAEQLEKEKKEEEAIKKAKELEDKKIEEKRKKTKIILKNTLGEEVSQKDYFYSTKDAESAPHFFAEVCGNAVDREDLLGVFNKVFKPKDGLLFYKARDKEVYIIIVPLKYSSTVGLDHNSMEGEFQKHAISFITEGSVNLDTLKNKLLRVASTIRIVAE